VDIPILYIRFTKLDLPNTILEFDTGGYSNILYQVYKGVTILGKGTSNVLAVIPTLYLRFTGWM